MSNELATTEAPALPGNDRLLIDPRKRSAAFWSGLDMKRPEDRRAMVQAIQGECIPGKKTLNTQQTIVNAVAHIAGKDDPDSEGRVEWVRTVLICADGTCIAFGSWGIHKSLSLICATEGPPPWQPGVVVTPVAQDVAGEKNWYILDYEPSGGEVQDGQPPQGKKRK